MNQLLCFLSLLTTPILTEFSIVAFSAQKPADGASESKAANSNQRRETGTDAKQKVDLETFLKANSEGKADQYKGFTVSGKGPHFFGDQKIIHRDKREEIYFTLTPYVVSGGKLTPLRSMEKWLDAQLTSKRLLHVTLHGENLKRPKGAPFGKVYSFSGRFEGDYQNVDNIVKKGTDLTPVTNKTPILVECTVADDSRPRSERNADEPDAKKDKKGIYYTLQTKDEITSVVIHNTPIGDYKLDLDEKARKGEFQIFGGAVRGTNHAVSGVYNNGKIESLKWDNEDVPSSQKAANKKLDAAKEKGKEVDAEVAADRDLRLAKALLSNKGSVARGKDRLKAIVEKYPETKAANEAKELLDKDQ